MLSDWDHLAQVGEHLSIDEFLSLMGELFNLSEAAAGAADGLNSMAATLRNVPTGFKVALERFRADTGDVLGEETEEILKGGYVETLPPPPILPPPPPELPPEVDTTGTGTPTTPGDNATDIVEINIASLVVQAEDPRQLTEALVEEARRQARRGGVTGLQLATQSGQATPTATTSLRL